MKTIRSNRVSGLKLIAVAGIVSLSSIGTAQAAKFGVRVVDESGEPVSGAAVCFGLHGNYKQFGAMFTGHDGSAIVDVPNVPLVVTVSKTRFSGVRMQEPSRSFSLVKQVKLIEGVPGPRCTAGSAIAEAKPGFAPIQVSRISFDEDSLQTIMKPEVSGAPSHYRVSTSRDFKNSRWQRYSDSIALSAALTDNELLYVQFRRFSGSNNGWLEARSDILTVNLPTVQ